MTPKLEMFVYLNKKYYNIFKKNLEDYQKFEIFVKIINVIHVSGHRLSNVICS